MWNWPLSVAAALTGLVLGSYAVTAGLRLARGEGSGLGRSHCDHCGETLGFRQTIPVASYVAARGACGRCGGRIDALHLAGELAGALVVLTAFAIATSPLRGGLLAGLGLILIAATAVDLKVKRLPDRFVALAGAAAIALAALSGARALLIGVGASAVVTLLLLIIREIGRRRRGEPGLGLGDVKLMAALSIWLGAGTPVMVVAACLLGLVLAPWLRGEDRRLPFGPMIAVASWGVGLMLERGGSPWAL